MDSGAQPSKVEDLLAAFAALRGRVDPFLPPDAGAAGPAEVAPTDPVGRERVAGRLAEALLALEELGRTISAPAPAAASPAPAPEPARADDGSAPAEEFAVDLAADYEHERLLMYRVILAFETVGAIVLVREIALGLH